jgi:hypothetical protein
MRRRLVIALGALCLALLVVGCTSQRKPIMPRTGIIPLQVWVVLGPGEAIGNRGNRGCRLTTQEIVDRIQSLQTHAAIYGQNVVFQWQPAQPVQAQDPALLPFTPRSRDWPNWHQQVVANNWQSGRLNIYFVGDLQLNGQSVVGLTCDPQCAQGQTPDRPWIALVDGGFQLSNGFNPTYTPALVTSYLVAEHEMTHYLGRFTNRTFGAPPNQRTYDNSEHVPNGSNNVLQDGGTPPPYPLVIPGRWNQNGTETQEIWDRIWAGTWNNP